MKKIEYRPLKFGKAWTTFLQFQVWIKTKKKAILFHPDYVMMTWETYRSLIKTNHKNERHLVILDEFSNL